MCAQTSMCLDVKMGRKDRCGSAGGKKMPDAEARGLQRTIIVRLNIFCYVPPLPQGVLARLLGDVPEATLCSTEF